MRQNLNRTARPVLLPLALCCLALLVPASIDARDKPKQDRFQGTVVAAGPKAITVKSKDNIYLVRTFNYAPDLEKKIQRKKLAPGASITVHYFRGTDVATRVN